MDEIILPFRFIPDGEPLPDLSEYRDPIILRARWERGDTLPAAAQAPVQTEPDASAWPPSREESERLLRIDPPIQPVHPEAWLPGGFATERLGLNLFRAVARQMLWPEPTGATAPAEAPTAGSRAVETSPKPAEPIPLEQFHVAPRQIQRKLKHAKTFDVEGNWEPENGRKFTVAARDFVRRTDVIRIESTSRGQRRTFFFQPTTSRLMMFNTDGEFVSGWELSERQLRHFLINSKL